MALKLALLENHIAYHSLCECECKIAAEPAEDDGN